MDNVTLIPWVLGIFGTVIGIFLNSLRVSMDRLRSTDIELKERLHAVQLLLAGSYAKKDDFDKCTHRLDTICNRLSNIEGKLGVTQRTQNIDN